MRITVIARYLAPRLSISSTTASVSWRLTSTGFFQFLLFNSSNPHTLNSKPYTQQNTNNTTKSLHTMVYTHTTSVCVCLVCMPYMYAFYVHMTQGPLPHHRGVYTHTTSGTQGRNGRRWRRRQRTRRRRKRRRKRKQ